MAIFYRSFNVLCVYLFVCLVSTFAELERFEHPAKPDGSLSFLVIGDWGRKGEYNQSLVATQMGKIGEKLNIDFVISTGDNFYDNGLSSESDMAFELSFTKIYTAKSLQKQWYSVLGNHDYRGKVEAQLSPVLRKIEPRWLCLRSFVVNAEVAEIFFVDTTPFIKHYYIDKKHSYDWSGFKCPRAYVKDLLKNLEAGLRKSTAKWKIVVGHHAIRSIGHHGDTGELVKFLLPMLKAYNVDFYMNGHDHCLEHISDFNSPLQFLTSGAGSKAWRGDVKPKSKEVKLFYDGQGFMSVQMNPSEAEIVFYDVHGQPLHVWKKSHQLYQAI